MLFRKLKIKKLTRHQPDLTTDNSDNGACALDVAGGGARIDGSLSTPSPP